ncbi:MAG TPA: formate/nitrite transporter family protein [Gemmatimonadaceae bacterium]|jgi:formate/nitrite transporter FocA (FNT family)|nr:formate/nitrite transporter family protein [Gemmatimonadaceae bacterium]
MSAAHSERDDDESGERSETLPDRPKSVEKPEAGTRLSAAEIHDNVLGPAEKEMKRPASALLWSSLASGLTIGFSFIAGGYAQTLVGPQYGGFVAGCAYPLGFLFIVFARSELFTENTLEPIIPLLHRRDLDTLLETLRLWSLLIIGNLVGAMLFAWVVNRAPILADAEIQDKLRAIAQSSTSDGFSLTLLRAVMAGWLIALMTWLLASTQDSTAQIILIWLTTAPISWFGFRHSIFGSVEAFYRVVDGSARLWAVAGSFILPAIIGNAIGGIVLVALLNYGQIQHERGA